MQNSITDNNILENSLFEISKTIAAKQNKYNEAPIKVSVIIPCYNVETLISRCLESICRQTISLQEIEVICIDDYSTDRTIDEIITYSNRIPNLILAKHNKNKKQGAARNTGLEHSKGEYILFVDADDYLRLDAIERLVFESKNHDLVIAQMVYDRFDKNFNRTVSNRSIESNIRTAAISGSIGWGVCGSLIKKSVIIENKIKFREGFFYEDIDFIIKLSLVIKNPKVLKEQLYYYIRRDGTTINSMNKNKLFDSALALKEIFLISNLFTQDEYSTWINHSSKWILFQFKRLDKNLKNYELKNELAKYFIFILKENKVLNNYPNQFILEIEDIIQNYNKNTEETHKDSFKYKPWNDDYSETFKNKIIFYCEVDYHIRAAVEIIRKLKTINHQALIVDSSKSKNFSSNRPLSDSEIKKYSDVEILQVDVSTLLPFSETATAYIFMNDLTYTRRLILENFGVGVPTIGIYEGINDNWNNDRKTLPRKPYRSVEYLLLPGIYEKSFFQDRDTRIVGLPNIYNLWIKKYTPPQEKLAIINVNFTYGVLEDRRDAFIESAVSACNELNIPYVISQHPADKANLSKYNVTKETIYESLHKGCILISRFSTTILEALAMGRSVIYHNPIKEEVPKFQNALGAYSISDTTESLKDRIIDELTILNSNIDMKSRAALFLHFHCNIMNNTNPSSLAAQEISSIIKTKNKRIDFKITQ